MSDATIQAFHDSILLPALTEISQASSLLEEYEVTVVGAGEKPNALLGRIASAIKGRRAGPSLLIANRKRHPAWPSDGGCYAMTTFFRVQGDEVYAGPVVGFWMLFNQNYHLFDHRYDNAIALHSTREITRPHVLNHVLNSFDFYKRFAFGTQPFPGYR